MRNLILMLSSALCLSSFSCDAKKGKVFSIEIKHFTGASGTIVFYSLNENSLKVSTDCDFANCTRKIVYKRGLTASESDQLYGFLCSLRLDTLKKRYEPKELVFDGLVSEVEIKGDKLPIKTVTLKNEATPATTALFKIVDSLVLDKKYRYFSR